MCVASGGGLVMDRFWNIFLYRNIDLCIFSLRLHVVERKEVGAVVCCMY